MRARLIAAAVAVVAALVGAALLLAYNPLRSYRHVDYPGDMHRWTVPVREHPWWSAYAAVGLIALGVLVAARLVPEAWPLIKREARRARRATGTAIRSLVRRLATHH